MKVLIMSFSMLLMGFSVYAKDCIDIEFTDGSHKKISVKYAEITFEDIDRTVSGSVASHDYVDLGLSVKWATCNLGAEKPQDKGDYYMYGDIVPATSREQDFPCPYIGEKVLPSKNDAATVNWGEEWRMPTKEEFQQLFEGCNWPKIEEGGRTIFVGTSIKTKNTIFLPAAGDYNTYSLQVENDNKEANYRTSNCQGYLSVCVNVSKW